MAEKKVEREKTQLYKDIENTQWPIIYSPEYNISFLGLEKLHPFDAGKWGRVYEFLKEAKMIRDDTTVRADEATREDLLLVHTEHYVDSLKWSVNVAGITEVPPVALLPNFIVQKKVLKPFRYQTGGTILAAALALQRGWSINIGGGFHHCCSTRGGGFCAYADITLCIRHLFEQYPECVTKAMIVDLDAHQGNGHERDFMEDERVYIMDVYNRDIYPHDGFAKRAIKRKVELSSYTGDEEYLRLVETNVKGALNEFTPHLVVYNAGTDILENDPLGCLSITPEGIVKRDEIVFSEVRKRGIPIIMVTSGGYQKSTARIIADSMLNLRALGHIQCEDAENCPPPADLVLPSTLPRSRSEGGIWAKFKNCANLTRSSTSDHIAKTTETSRSSSLAGDPQSRSPGSASGGSRLRGSGSSLGIARSRTQEDVRKFDENDEDDFVEDGCEAEEIDFRTMLEKTATTSTSSAMTSSSTACINQQYQEKQKTEQKAEKTISKDFVHDSKIKANARSGMKVEGVEYDSSPYDSDDSDGVIDTVDTIYKVDCPSYDDFVKQKKTQPIEEGQTLDVEIHVEETTK